MPSLKADGLISNHADYMALDERVLDDWRMWKHAKQQKAVNDAQRQQARRR